VQTPFRLRTVAVSPGAERVYDSEEWRDALVVVEHGELELEAVSGARCRFGHGDMLWLVGLPLRALRNGGTETVVLAAVSRDEFPGEAASKSQCQRGLGDRHDGQA
jgi:hypothetical protein